MRRRRNGILYRKRRKERGENEAEKMALTAVVIDSLVAICLLASVVKDRERARDALRIAWSAIRRLGPSVLALTAVIGIIVGFVLPRRKASTMGDESRALEMLVAAALGSVLFIPAIIAFPLATILLRKGARVANSVIFLSARACVKLPQELAEMRFLGRRFALLSLGLTVPPIILMGLAAEGLYHRKPIMES